MITKAVDKSEQDELYGYEVKQVSLEELKNENNQLKAEYKKVKEQNTKQQTEIQNIKKQNTKQALSNILWVVVLDCDFFVQDIAFVPSYSHVS